MLDDTHSAFKRQVYQAISMLYRSHPRLDTVDHSTVRAIEKDQGGNIIEAPDIEAEHGTILWLHREGLVRGRLTENKPINGPVTASITEAQLTARTLSLLADHDSNLGGPLGEMLVQYQGTRHEPLAIEKLMVRLLGH